MKTKGLPALTLIFLILALAACQARQSATTPLASNAASSVPSATSTPSPTAMPTATPTPQPTPTPVPPSLADYPVDPSKLTLIPPSLETLSQEPAAYQKAPNPFLTGNDFFEQWLQQSLLPALPQIEEPQIKAQYLASDPAYVTLAGNNNRRSPLSGSPFFFYFEHEGQYYPGFYFLAGFDEAFKQEPLAIIFFPSSAPAADQTLADLADPRLNFDFLSLANGPDTAFPQELNQLIAQGFKPSAAADPRYLLGFGSLYFAILP